MIPFFAVVGHSKSGKTTLIRDLIKEMHARGYKLAVIKHDPENHGKVDAKDSDTSAFWEEGVAAVFLSSPSRLTLFRRVEYDLDPEEIIPFCGTAINCVILEGYKKMKVPKIEIWGEKNKSLGINRQHLLAIVYDKKDEEKALVGNPGKGIALIPRNEINTIVDLLEKTILKINIKGEQSKNVTQKNT